MDTVSSYEKLDAIIVGAGISGLFLAQRLKSSGASFLLIEKSRGVGGRIATRREGAFTFDHGAQFYRLNEKTSKSSEFLSQHERWRESKVAKLWFKENHAEHWVCPRGLTQLAKSFALTEHIVFNERVVRLEQVKSLSSRVWRVTSELGANWIADTVYLSSPLPQSLKILQDSSIFFPEELQQIQYAPALVALYGFGQVQNWSFQNYLQDVGTHIFSVSDQFAKGVSSQPALTVVMQPGFSQKHFDDQEEMIFEEIRNALLSEAEIFISTPDLKVRQLKKWRLSHPLGQAKETFFCLKENSLFLLGDAFGGGSITGAIRSAESIPV
jgi:renalase